MSKVVGFIVGAALVVAGIVTGNPALIIQGSLMIVTQAVVLLTAPKTPARQASEMAIQLGEQPRSAIFGEGATAGSLVDGFNFGGKYGTQWEVLVIRLADHKCLGMTGFYVNDEWNDYVGNGYYPRYGTDNLQVFFRDDTSTQALPDIVLDNGPDWTALDIGRSGCDVVVAYKCDKPDAKRPVWPGGRPRFLFVVKGKFCYDPRLDDTVPGGAGDHRWEDPDTWEWTNNPAVCRYNWVRGIYAEDSVLQPGRLLVGRGLTASEAPPENIFAAANLCDEAIDGEKRYAVAGPIYAHQEFLEVEEMFALATGGTVITRQGSVELEPGGSKSVVASFTDDDILSGSEKSWNHRILSESNGEWLNTVVARYVEPTQKWNDHAAPVMRDIDDITADGKPRETQITLRLCRYSKQAMRVAEIYRRLGRLWGRAQVTLGPRFCEIEDGDWVSWTSARYGFTITFRVEGYQIDEKWQNTLTLREINADVYGEADYPTDQSVVNPPDPPPDIGSPSDGNWTLTAVSLVSGGASIPALRIAGNSDDDELVEAIIFEYWQDDGVSDPVADPDDIDWVVYGTLPPATTQVDISSVTGGSVYYAAVTYIVDGEPGDRLVLGPVTIGEISIGPRRWDSGALTWDSELQTMDIG